MSTDDTKLAVAALAAAFPRAEIRQETVSVYVRALADLPPAMVNRAVGRLIATSRFFPTVAEIREAVVESHVALPTVDQAAQQLTAGARRDARRAEFHPLVWEARSTHGQPFDWGGDSSRFMLKDAVQTYARMRERTIMEYVSGDRRLQEAGMTELLAADAIAEITG